MDPVTLLHCPRCKISWVDGTEAAKGKCPQCLRSFGVPRVDLVRVRECEVAAMFTERARETMDAAKLGHCPHGKLAPVLCEICSSI